ncbi:MAG: flavodoxin-dependent (E)-4-hydroxy-3-methylbut-2-enyl-diphosphate synthase [Oscillospiraceae bacterium]|jgi:(E)-4-hydroxy-3-methylbut-2-enyl-diphosphate synthase|nr:flavodoxin-dependent (E)-4-hydroxy-3-methylbut-2-enyl-diphosphate synthase [Oscillospiraceae bacterium]
MHKTKKIKVGTTIIGGGEKISIQSMLSVPSSDFDGNIKQAIELEKSGCDILRVAIPNKDTVKIIPEIKKNIKIPIVADIHFDEKLAIESVFAGADKIRINPGNISSEGIKNITKVCRNFNIPIRIGINSGSIKFENPNSKILAENALENIKILENLDFKDIVVSVKSSCVRTCIEAYRILNKKTEYPLHIGITESGTEKTGIIKSSIGIGALLLDGIGDTIRVSLSADPEKEIETGISILKSLGLRDGATIISCPTCGRATIDVVSLAEKLEKELKNLNKNIKIAVMGCPVNGPGEAKGADLAITGANGIGFIFKKGIIIRKTQQEKLVEEILNEVKAY